MFKNFAINITQASSVSPSNPEGTVSTTVITEDGPKGADDLLRYAFSHLGFDLSDYRPAQVVITTLPGVPGVGPREVQVITLLAADGSPIRTDVLNVSEEDPRSGDMLGSLGPE